MKSTTAPLFSAAPTATPRAHYQPAFAASLRTTAPVAANRQDDALLAWLGQPEAKQKADDWQETEALKNKDVFSTGELYFGSVDEIFALLASS